MEQKNSTSLPRTAVVPHSKDHSDWLLLKEQARVAVNSGLLPRSVDTPEKAAIIALKGKELGLPFMQSLSSISVINGKAGLSSELMLALIYKKIPGFLVVYKTTTNEKCEIEATRPGHPLQLFTFTIEDAKRAGVLGKDSWRQYPAAMLRARCISAMARAVAPDAIMGGYTPEELGGESHGEDEWTQPIPNISKSMLPNPSSEVIVTKLRPPVSDEPPREADNTTPIEEPMAHSANHSKLDTLTKAAHVLSKSRSVNR